MSREPATPPYPGVTRRRNRSGKNANLASTVVSPSGHDRHGRRDRRADPQSRKESVRRKPSPPTPSVTRQNAQTRPYQQHGRHLVTKALPYLIERVKDPAIADDALSPVERAARDWRQEVVADLGGLTAVAAAKLALLDAAVGTKIVLDSLDRYLFALATMDGLVNRRNRRAFAIVADRMRVADSLARQLAALGMERHAPLVPSLTEYLAQKTGGRDGSAADAALPKNQVPSPGGGDHDHHDDDRDG